MSWMSGYMDRAREGGVQWGAVAFGWVVAVAAGFLIGLLLRALYALAAGPATGTEGLTAAFVISLISGFLGYLAGGYAAGRVAGVSGGLNGAMTAVFGLILGIVLAIILVVLALIVSGGEGLPTAPVGFGSIAGGAFLAGLILFAVNLLGGYLGGRLGARSR